MLSWVLMMVVAAGGAHPTAQLDYQRAESAGDCPDEARLRAEVAARLGYDPFGSEGELLVSARVQREGVSLVARLTVARPDAPPGRRTLSSERADCSELAAAMALALSLAIDPLQATSVQAPEALPPAPAPALPPEPSPPAVTPPPAPKRVPWHLSGTAGAGTAVAAMPSWSAGPFAGVRARRGLLSLGLTGTFLVPTTTELPRGSVESTLLSAMVSACAHQARFRGCASLEGGAQRSRALGLTDPRAVVAPYLAAGAEVGGMLELTSRLSLEVAGFVTARLVQVTLEVNDQPAWVSPALVGGARLGLGWDFGE